MNIEQGISNIEGMKKEECWNLEFNLPPSLSNFIQNSIFLVQYSIFLTDIVYKPAPALTSGSPACSSSRPGWSIRYRLRKIV